MRSQGQLCVTPRRAEGVHRKAQLAAVSPGKNEFAIQNSHAMEFLRVIQAQEAVFHFVGSRVLAHHKCQVAAGALNPAGCVQLGEEAKKHWLSLPNRIAE